MATQLSVSDLTPTQVGNVTISSILAVTNGTMGVAFFDGSLPLGATAEIAFVMLYALIIIVSSVGNYLVCRVLLHTTTGHGNSTAAALGQGTGCTRMLIVNLAYSDLLLSLFNIPTNLMRLILNNWPLGSTLCTLMPFVQAISAHCSAWTMLVIAYERYQKVVQPQVGPTARANQVRREPTPTYHRNEGHDRVSVVLGSRVAGRGAGVAAAPAGVMLVMQPNATGWRGWCIGACQAVLGWLCCAFCFCLPVGWVPEAPVGSDIGRRSGTRLISEPVRIRLILASVWAISIVLSIPHALFSELFYFRMGEIEMTRCRSNIFSSPEQAKLLSAYTFCSQYLGPIGVTAYFYFHIGVFLWRLKAVGEPNENRRHVLGHFRRRRVLILILVVVVFAICWLPLNLYNLLTDFHYTRKNVYVFFSFHFLAMSSVCYNPFIYCWLNPNFRSKMFELLRYIVPHWLLSACCMPGADPADSAPNVVAAAAARRANGLVNMNGGMGVSLGNDFSENQPSNSITSCALNSTANEHAIREMDGASSANGIPASSVNAPGTSRYNNNSGDNNNNNSGDNSDSSASTIFKTVGAARRERARRLAMATMVSGRRRMHDSVSYTPETETEITWVGPTSASSA